MKNQKFIGAVVLICIQLYMLLYDLKAIFGLFDLFIIGLIYYLLIKRKIVLKDYMMYVLLLVIGSILCSVFHSSSILGIGIVTTLAQMVFIISSYYVYCSKQKRDHYIRQGFINKQHE